MQQYLSVIDYRDSVFWLHSVDADGRIYAFKALLPAYPSKRAFRAASPPRRVYLVTTEVRCVAQTYQQMFQVVLRLISRL
jgi:hypothetical protein